MRKISPILVEELSIPPSKIAQILTTFGSLDYLVSHDLQNISAAVAMSGSLLSLVDSENRAEPFSQFSCSLEGLNEALSKLRCYTARLTSLSSHIQQILGDITRLHSSISMKSSNDSLRTLQILFPRAILSGILSELASNALKASSGSANILVKYKMRGFSFVLELHDDGPGIQSLKGIAPLRGSGLLKRTFSGLSIIDTIVRDAGGSIFVGPRSVELGGAYFVMSFPVHAYKILDKTYEDIEKSSIKKHSSHR